MNNIKSPEELLDFMSNNINYGYLGKNGRVYHYDDLDFNLDWYEQYILENSGLIFISVRLGIYNISEEYYFAMKKGFRIWNPLIGMTRLELATSSSLTRRSTT